MASIYDVAKLAGVSPATVSRAFAKPGRVHEDTLARIHAAAEELGYRSKVAQHQEFERRRQLGLIATDMANPYFAEIIRGTVAAALEADYTVTLVDAQESIRLEEAALARIIGQVDGIILAAPRMPDGPIRAAARERPVLLLNRSVPEVPCVLPNNRAGIDEAMTHLVALGHKRITYLSGPESSYANNVRWRAMRDAGTRLGVETRAIGPFPPNLLGGEGAARRFAPHPSTAVICFDDLLALGFMRELNRMGFQIPRDVSVIGVDNILSGELCTPQLTTIAAPFSALGSVAVHTLISLIGGARMGAQEHVTLPMRLIVRGTTAPVANQ